jgi:type IV secretory pathway VirB10-like protein
VAAAAASVRARPVRRQMSKQSPNELIRSHEIARPQTRQRRQGEPAHHLPGGGWRFARDDLVHDDIARSGVDPVADGGRFAYFYRRAPPDRHAAGPDHCCRQTTASRDAALFGCGTMVAWRHSLGPEEPRNNLQLVASSRIPFCLSTPIVSQLTARTHCPWRAHAQ